MVSNHIFTGSNDFIILGTILCILALVSFPTRVEFADQGEIGGSEHYNVGWLIAPIIGVWGLASLAIGPVGYPRTNCSVVGLLLFISAFVCVGLFFAFYMFLFYGLGVVASVGRGEPFFLLYFGLVLAPSIVVLTSTVKFLKAGERAIFQVSKKARIAIFVALAAVPLSYSIAFLAFIYWL